MAALHRQDSNLRPAAYEAAELVHCSTVPSAPPPAVASPTARRPSEGLLRRGLPRSACRPVTLAAANPHVRRPLHRPDQSRPVTEDGREGPCVSSGLPLPPRAA